MKIVKTKGIVIIENNMADFDKMLTILTPNGKVEAVAKGARRPRSLLLAGTQFLCFGEFMLYKSGNIYNVNSCETIEVFYNIRTDLDKLKYAAHITKIINDVTTENQNSYKILQLYLNTLYTISNTNKSLDFIISIFKLRLLSIIGFRPVIDSCQVCKNQENFSYFSLRDNGFKCKNCGKMDKGAIEISETTKDAIRYIILADSKKIFSFDIPEESNKELEIISKLFFNEKLEKEYKII
ncbi:MAG: DNA repair protein RecO [Clostridiales bacterium]|nr:DNA repair protein RecO [Clostridiales bacterium]